MTFPREVHQNDGAAASAFFTKVNAAGLDLTHLSPLAQTQSTLANLMNDLPAMCQVPWDSMGSVVIPGANGGTGVVNTGKTVTLGGNLATAGGALNIGLSGDTSLIFPQTGTLLTTDSVIPLATAATRLQTGRNINGVLFDGTANITVTADASTLTSTTLNPAITSSSLTSVGTLTNLSVSNPITGSLSGNAATATKLQTARTINGVSFDGSANIALPTASVDAGTLTGATLATNVLASSLTSGGATFNVTTGFKVGGTQIIGTQQAAIANLNLGTLVLLTDVITGMGTVQTKINTLLAELRTHGLIAP